MTEQKNRDESTIAALAEALGMSRNDVVDLFIAGLVILFFMGLFARFTGCGVDDVTTLVPLNTEVLEEAVATENDSDVEATGLGLTAAEENAPAVPLHCSATPEGCPDSDEDGVIDEDDRCVRVPGPAPRGCPLDRDGDGVNDDDDRCPDDSGSESFLGCPPDTDSDGIYDRVDQCPDRAGPEHTSGCPEVRLSPAESSIIADLENIEFKTGSAKIAKNSFVLLDGAVKIMKAHGEFNMRIEGHTDNTGKSASNLKLSSRRAASCKTYIMKKGISADRLEAEGFGQLQPIVPNSSAENRRMNRRVEFILE